MCGGCGDVELQNFGSHRRVTCQANGGGQSAGSHHLIDCLSEKINNRMVFRQYLKISTFIIRNCNHDLINPDRSVNMLRQPAGELTVFIRSGFNRAITPLNFTCEGPWTIIVNEIYPTPHWLTWERWARGYPTTLVDRSAVCDRNPLFVIDNGVGGIV